MIAQLRDFDGLPRTKFNLSAILALAAAGLVSCSEPSDHGSARENAIRSGWRGLSDGSIGRLQSTFAGDRRADRCWIGERHDCVWLSERRTPYGRILVAGRALLDEPPVGLGPRYGYSCAIYPGGAIEQRIIQPEGDLLTRWSTEGGPWSHDKVRRLLAQAGLSHSEVVSCKALHELVGDDDVERLLSITVRRAVAPPVEAA